MARQRLIHPDAPHDEAVAALSLAARVVWAYLPCHADKEGRLFDKPFKLKLAILPLDAVDMNALLGELAGRKLIQRYVAEDGTRLIQIRNFGRYQRPHKYEPDSTLPAPTETLTNSDDCPTTVVAPSDYGSPTVVVPSSTGILDPVSGSGSGKSLSERERGSLAGTAPPPESPSPKAQKPRKPRPDPVYPPEFERVWAETGRSGNKLPAFNAWEAVGRPSAEAVVEGWRHAEKHDKRWQGPNPCIPHLSTWLNARGWEDRPTLPGAARASPAALTFEQIQAKAREERERKRRAEQLEAQEAAQIRDLLRGAAPS